MKSFAALLALAACTVNSAAATDRPVLRVCADPNNLPFSNQAGEGFENRLVERLASELGVRLQYVWWAQRRGYARNTLDAQQCDLWPGVAAGIETMATTRAYYHSTYVFLTRASRQLAGLSLDDPRLRSLVIGVQMIGDDAMNTPPVHALARRGIVANVRGYMLFGDYSRPDPLARIVDAVVDGEVDVAMVWGPVAGYYAGLAGAPLHLEAIPPSGDGLWQMSFGISIGVAKGNTALAERLDHALDSNAAVIERILRKYRIPLSS